MEKSKPKTLPEIVARKEVARSRLIAVEQVDLKFSNGAERCFEKIKGSGQGAVMVIPMLDDNTLLLIREYCAGTHNYQLGFPKGLIDPGEAMQDAANRELQEEIGFAAKRWTHLHQVCMAPAFFNARMDIFVARDLYESKLQGDEPEPMEVVRWPINDYRSLLAQPDFTEARSIAALMLLRDFLEAPDDE
ncbi:ADP compounds hydrolase NudE [Thalassotalea mangrovi]|uniref:ADP compounds hydrolase NudE n=1 Tax=Thalassotalea mangrovi TaxID=2572245 RepID=A0A4U1B5A9_9GAMM|nr:ADP compounds hydrolase NudE [Thalassotalea mangrovi]TKB45476.1 ADP compounds hydrolase NudE [Thalassotalea mangrovi]